MPMPIQKTSFGETSSGEAVDRFTLTNDSGTEVQIMTYGGIILSLKTPDKHGKLGDIVLGFNTLDEYVRYNPYFGCLVGRYANRIAKGEFELDGKNYKLAQNDGPNHLHGGVQGFDKVLWHAEADGDGLVLSIVSLDGKEGYPGKLEVRVTYTLTDTDELRIRYRAETDAPTIVNLTNHSYFNLAGGGDILAHDLKLNAAQFTPIDETFIPTGDVKGVSATPFEFRDFTAIGARIDENDDQLNHAGGYDHNWILEREDNGLSWAASVREESSGRQLEVYTTQPGVQFYSGNLLPDLKGKDGQMYRRRSGFCLETQHFPDSPNQPAFPPTVLRPEEKYDETTVFKFSVID